MHGGMPVLSKLLLPCQSVRTSLRDHADEADQSRASLRD